MIRLWLAFLAALVAVPVRAAPTHITPALVAETDTPAAGKDVTLAFVMRPAPEWHGYWQNPGDAGLPTRVAWTAPKGLTFDPLHYPVPQPLLIAGLMNYVYEKDYALLVTAHVPAGLAPGTRLAVRAKLDWLACNPQTCVPESATLAMTLTVGDGAIAPDMRARFDRWRAALPKPLGAPARYEVANGRFRIELPLPASVDAGKAYFFAGTDGAIDYAAPQTAVHDGDRLVIETAARPKPPARVDGLVSLGPDMGLSFTATPGRVAPAKAGSSSAASGEATGFWLALGGAILGGLLLNIMPCVFPILSLKALSLARSGGHESEARGEALAYTAGVVLVCAALGAAVLALRTTGELVGWAFQLQDPRVIAGLLLLVLAIALNLAGLFELPVLSGGSGLASAGGKTGAFWTGALAAFVATPCAGPFLGVALGAAITLPAAEAMAVFVGLGLGVALPFLLLGFVPALRRWLPRPGAWMDLFRHILAVPMLLTALGLAWILGREAGVDGMGIGLSAALLLALGLWWAGRRQAALKGGAWWPVLAALVGAVALIAIVPRDAAAAVASAEAGAVKFDEAKLAELRKQGRPIFLYFTADWCLTCKVNERGAIDRAEVIKAFADKHVVVMVGDWTRGDPAISRFINAHGRSGVPFYLFYPAGGGEPRELPQILTPGLLAGLA
jgi:thiol:disulfide interchange protein